jgi:dipeptidyl aminopeptidase/acylaminoacyl peptidase
MRISGVTFAARRTHRARNTVLTVVILLLLAVLAVIIISAYQGWSLLHPEKKDIDAFSSNIVPEYRDISFKDSDGKLILQGWLFPVKNSGRAVIMAHSYGKNRLEFGIQTIDLVKFFMNKGYNVFTFDFRNSGKSGGDMSTMGYYEKEDLQAAISYVRRQGPEHIVLLGFSSGASASILAAADSGNVDAVIADTPYSDLGSYLEDSLNKKTGLPAFPFNKTILISMELMGGIDASNASPMDSLKELSPAWLFLIHGRDDAEIPVENSRSLYAAYSKLNPGKTELWETDAEGSNGSYAASPDEYLERLSSFLNKVYP